MDERTAEVELMSTLQTGLEDLFAPVPEHEALQAFADRFTESSEAELAKCRAREQQILTQRRTAHAAAAEALARHRQPIAATIKGN